MTAPVRIEIYEPVDLPAAPVRDALMTITSAIAAHEAPYERLELGVNLHDLRLPVEGEVRVPVDAEIENRPHRWECALRLRAHSNERFFPSFEGTLSVTPDGHNTAEIWLQGAYRPPGARVGKGIDAAAMHGVAERSLRGFLEWLAREVRVRVEEAEGDAVQRARRHG